LLEQPIKIKMNTITNNKANSISFSKSIGNFNAFIRFSDGKLKQKPILQRVDEPIPDHSCFASPIYYLQENRIQVQQKLVNPYAVKENSVATKLQNEAENEGTVFYPIYIESDSEKNLNTQIKWLKEFCKIHLNTISESCNWFYSGNRSIHVHVPKLATEHNIDILRELAQEFEHDIDAQIYSRKRQFRLPGVKHNKTGLAKVEIQPDWSHQEIIRESVTADIEPPESFKDVLADTFGSDVLDNPQQYLWQPESDSETIQAGLNKWEKYETCRGRLHQKWKAHYSHPVSPYAKAGNGNRSLLIAKVQDGVFSEKRETHQEGRKEEQVFNFLPAEVYQFWGCDRKFTVNNEYRPVKFSKTDYKKFAQMDIQKYDFFAVIGGKSGSSRIFSIPRWLALAIAEESSFKEALELLEGFGYDTGSSGRVESSYHNKSNEYQNPTKNTAAYDLQQKAEEEGIDTLTHLELRTVANRLLQQYGIKDTRHWFQQQYGDDFDRQVTGKQIKNLCDSFDDLPDYEFNNITRTSI